MEYSDIKYLHVNPHFLAKCDKLLSIYFYYKAGI